VTKRWTTKWLYIANVVYTLNSAGFRGGRELGPRAPYQTGAPTMFMCLTICTTCACHLVILVTSCLINLCFGWVNSRLERRECFNTNRYIAVDSGKSFFNVSIALALQRELLTPLGTVLLMNRDTIWSSFCWWTVIRYDQCIVHSLV